LSSPTSFEPLSTLMIMSSSGNVRTARPRARFQSLPKRMSSTQPLSATCLMRVSRFVLRVILGPAVLVEERVASLLVYEAPGTRSM
jgi:hypothetical protein